MTIKGFDTNYFVTQIYEFAKKQSDLNEWTSHNTVETLKASLPVWYPDVEFDEDNGFTHLDAAAQQLYVDFGVGWGIAPNEYFVPSEYKASWVQKYTQTHIATAVQASAKFDADIASEAYNGNYYAHYLAEGAAIGANPSNKFDESDYLQSLITGMGIVNEETGDPMTVAELRAIAVGAEITPLDFYIDYPEYQAEYPRIEVPAGERVNVTTPATGSTFTLTNGTDIATANIFNAGLVYTPGGDDRVNSLQNEDKLTGVGEKPTLNATLGNSNDNGDIIITPKLDKIEIVNVDFTGNNVAASGAPVVALDMQDANALTEVNINRISQSTNMARIENIKQKDLNLMSIANTHANNVGTVEFSYAAGVLRGANSSTLKLNDVQVLNVNIGENTSLSTAAGVGVTGYETLNIASIGAANTVGVLNLPMDTGVTGTVKAVHSEDKNGTNLDKTLNLSVANGVVTALNNTTNVEAVIYGGGINLAQGRIATIDASELQASLSLAIGAVDNASGLNNPVRTDGADILTTGEADTSGLTQEVTITGTANADVFYLNDFLQAGDVINGGDGADRVVVYSQGNVGRISSVETVDVQIDGSRVAGNDTITLNFANIADATLESVRNVTNRPVDANADGVLDARLAGDDAANQTVNLYNLTAAQAVAINISHSTTANNGIGDTTLNATLAADTAADSMTVTINENWNIDPRFNFTLDNLTAAGTRQVIETLTIVDNDSESNSIALTNSANYTGTINVNGPGAAGKFVNFDSRAQRVALLVDNNAAGQQTGSYDQRGGYNLDVDGMENDYSTAAPGTNGAIAAAAVDTVISGTAGLTANVRYNTLDNGFAGETRLIAQTFNASTEASDVIARFEEITRSNGISSMSVTGGAGNDTFIFDAQGIRSAGYTSGDTVAGGTGLDTLVVDGNTIANTINGTPGVRGNVTIQKSEWDNTTGIDVLRLAGNQGAINVGNGAIIGSNTNGAGYYIEIDNEFVRQADAGNNLKIISNDGDFFNNYESDLILNLRPLAQTSNVTFIGANDNGIPSNGVATASNRIQLEDNSANGFNTLNGGDSNILQTSYAANSVSNVLTNFNGGVNKTFATTTEANLAWQVAIGQITDAQAVAAAAAAAAAGTISAPTLIIGDYTNLFNSDANNNVLEIFNTAEVSINDLSLTRNFGRIEATNDTAVAQTLKLTLNNTVMDALVDSSHTASAAQVERLVVTANNNANIAGAIQTLQIDASQVGTSFGLDVLGATVGRSTAIPVNNVISATAGNDHVVYLGNYTTAQAAAYALTGTGFNGANDVTNANLQGWATGVDFTRGTLNPFDDILIQYTGRLISNGGTDTLETFGGVNLAALGTDLGGWNVRGQSTVRVTEAQLQSMDNNNHILSFIGAGVHGLVVEDSNSDGVITIDLSNIMLIDKSASLILSTNAATVNTTGGILTQDAGNSAPVVNKSVDFNTTTYTNHDPIAVIDFVDKSAFTAAKNTSINISASTLLANDTDIDNTGNTNAGLTIVSVLNNGAITDGTAVLNNDGTITFTPTTGYTGAATFDYIVSDGKGGYAVGTVNGNVADVTPGTLTWPAITTLDEAAANDGSVAGTISVTLTGDTFVAAPTATFANVPTGLTPVFTRVSDTTGTISFTGNAAAHVNANDISNISVAFDAADFTKGVAAANSSKTISIDFDDAPAVAPGTLAYTATTLKEAATNDGKVTETITVTLSNDTFVAAPTAAFTGVPAGLTAAFTRVSDTTGTIALTGNAAAHANANDASFTIAFDANDFTKALAPTVASQAILVDFADTATYTDKSADLGTAQTADTTLSGTGGSFNFTDSATVQNNVVISTFTTDDKITVSGVTTGYSFTNNGVDVAIEYNNGGTLNKIVLTGVVSASSLVYDEASFETAIGFNAFSYA